MFVFSPSLQVLLLILVSMFVFDPSLHVLLFNPSLYIFIFLWQNHTSHWVLYTAEDHIEFNYPLVRQKNILLNLIILLWHRKTSCWIESFSHDTKNISLNSIILLWHRKTSQIPLVLWICCHLPKPVFKYHSHRRGGWR